MFYFSRNAIGCFIYLIFLQVLIQQVRSTRCCFSSRSISVEPEQASFFDIVQLQVFKYHYYKYKFFHYKSSIMPVITRSMTKCRPVTTTLSSSDLKDSVIMSSPTTLVSSSGLSSPSSVSLESIASLNFENQFEISTNTNLEFSNFCHPCLTSSPHSLHNFSMESGCDEIENTPLKDDPDLSINQASSDDKIMQVLMAISSQMVTNMQELHEKITKNTSDLQEQLRQNDFKISTEIQRITEENDEFKREIRNELLSLRNGGISNNSVLSVPAPIPSLPVVSSSSPSVPVDSPVSQGPNTTIPTQGDAMQSQMLQLLNETFSKLSTVLLETKSESKTDWPKFSGETTKFRDWYLAIMAQLSLPPWNVLYDPVRNDVVSTTSHTQLNGKLCQAAH
jgi:D-ribose pyranose/furanose isomerase RbsD